MPKMIALCTGLLLAASACGGAASSPKSAEAQAGETAGSGLITARGSRVSLWLPEGAVRPLRMLLYVNENPGVSVGIMEMTGADEKAAGEMLRGAIDGATEQGLEEQSPASRGAASGILAQGEVRGLAVKVLLLRQGLAIASITVQHEPSAAAIVEKILASIRVNEKAALDPLAVHGMAIADLRGFEVWPMMAHPIVLREPGTKPPFPPGAPLLALMVLPYEKPDPTDQELGQALGGLLANMQPNLEQAKHRPFKLDDLPAVEVIAPGKKDGVEIEAYGFIARGADSAIAGFGHVGKERSADVVQRFAGLVGSIQLDDSIVGPPAR